MLFEKKNHKGDRRARKTDLSFVLWNEVKEIRRTRELFASFHLEFLNRRNRSELSWFRAFEQKRRVNRIVYLASWSLAGISFINNRLLSNLEQGKSDIWFIEVFNGVIGEVIREKVLAIEADTAWNRGIPWFFLINHSQLPKFFILSSFLINFIIISMSTELTFDSFKVFKE